jgi:hypothetical protein
MDYQELVSWNNSFGENACKSNRIGRRYPSGKLYIRPCNSTSCFTCHIYGDQMKNRASGKIFRFIGNVSLAGYALYWITISLPESSGDPFHDWYLLESSWARISEDVRRKFRKTNNFEYVRLASQGQGNKPHYHVIATIPITPENGRKFNLDVDCQHIAHPFASQAKISRYMKRNMAEVPHHISNVLTSSRNFHLWANPALWRIGSRFQSTSVDVYIAHRTNKIPFKACSFCEQKFPASPIWFQKSGDGRLRSLCKACQKLQDMALFANKRARGYGAPGKLTTQDIAHLFEQARHDKGYVDYHSDKQSPVILDYFACVLDHITPLCNGGSNTPDNLCITSKENNARKGSMPLPKWIVRQAARSIRTRYMPDDISVQMRMF